MKHNNKNILFVLCIENKDCDDLEKLITLRFIYFKIREPQNIEGWNRYALSFKSKI